MTLSDEKRRRVMLMYLEFAQRDLEIGRALSASFARELERWGRARMDHIDRLNAIQLIPVVEKEGFQDAERFVEVARRLERFRGKDPNDRLIRTWWETARSGAALDNDDPNLQSRSLFSDKALNRKRGRPKKAVSKK